MDYTNGASGAQSSAVATALTKYFGFGNSVQYVYEGHEAGCQWCFIAYDADRAAIYETAAQLENLIAMAKAKRVACTDEEAVLDDMQSTVEAMRQAQRSLRQKLKLMDFADDLVARICRSAFDLDGDGELSLEEAAAVTDIGEAFSYQSQMKSLEVLRYFTALTAIPDNAFRSSTALTTVYLPEQVQHIGSMAFSGCPLKYLVLLHADGVVATDAANGLSAQAAVFVPEALVGAYQGQDVWNVCGVSAYTVTPAALTITANSYTRRQGEDNPVFEFTCKGFRNKETVDVLETQPVITCEATKDSPAGQYDIVISGATAHNYDITFENGVLTIEGESGIVTVSRDSDNDNRYYDLQGRRILAPRSSHLTPHRKGLYIDRSRRRVVTVK